MYICKRLLGLKIQSRGVKATSVRVLRKCVARIYPIDEYITNINDVIWKWCRNKFRPEAFVTERTYTTHTHTQANALIRTYKASAVCSYTVRCLYPFAPCSMHMYVLACLCVWVYINIYGRFFHFDWCCLYTKWSGTARYLIQLYLLFTLHLDPTLYKKQKRENCMHKSEREKHTKRNWVAKEIKECSRKKKLRKIIVNVSFHLVVFIVKAPKMRHSDRVLFICKRTEHSAYIVEGRHVCVCVYARQYHCMSTDSGYRT